MPPAHLPILKRAGLVLLVVGLLDIGLMVYAIASQVSYSSSLNIFAVVAGVFLLRGSLRVAGLVRWFAMFLVSAFVAVTLAAPVLQPLDLTLTELQVHPLEFLGSLCFFVVGLGLFAWLSRELGSPPVQAARASAGLPVRGPGVPVALGVTLAVVLAVASLLVQRSESAARAIEEARSKHGDEYHYHVSSLSYHSSAEGNVVSDVVTAWKNGSITELPFQWHE